MSRQNYNATGSRSPINWIPIEDLLLDLDNPRLPTYVNKNEHSIIEFIAKNTSLEDLMSAISENGFFPGEPLIAIPEPASGKFIVIEGNRRLSAVKLLNDISLLNKKSARMADIVANTNNPPASLPVIIRDNREDVLPYLGFRHISGVKQWEPLAKARYIKQLFDLTSPTLAPTERYYEVAKIIGSKRDFIKRNLDAYAIYSIIEENDFFNIDEVKEDLVKFSVLSTALADERVGEFIKLGRSGSADPIVNADAIDVTHLRELTEWMFKDQGGDKGTVLGESRNIKYLSQVLNNSKATDVLRSGASLDYAYRLTKGVTEDFKNALYLADQSLSSAAAVVANVEFSQELLEVALSISKKIKLIGTTIKDKKASDDDF